MKSSSHQARPFKDQLFQIYRHKKLLVPARTDLSFLMIIFTKVFRNSLEGLFHSMNPGRFPGFGGTMFEDYVENALVDEIVALQKRDRWEWTWLLLTGKI